MVEAENYSSGFVSKFQIIFTPDKTFVADVNRKSQPKLSWENTLILWESHYLFTISFHDLSELWIYGKDQFS